LKKILFGILLFVLGTNAIGQNITKFEYFIDTDPGVGLATAANPAASPTVTDFNIPISMASLSTGFHTLYIRGQNTAGEWTHTHFRKFYIDIASLPTTDKLVKFEYFFDADPGFGNGTAAPIAPPVSSVINQDIFAIPSSLPIGTHTIYVRARDSSGDWTQIASGNFSVAAAVPAPTITSFTPTSGSTSTTVTITGTNFTGATAVTFGGIAATSFTVVSSTSLTAVVGNGASGNIAIETPGGTASLVGFIYNDNITGNEPIGNSDRVEIFPNPSESQEFHLQFPSSWQGKNSTIEIMDMTGRIVYSTSSSISQPTLILFLGKSVEAGLYIVTVQVEKKNITLKMFVNK
jgi:hypothetical protein